MKISVRAGAAGLLTSLAVAAPALAGPAVSVRVEGQTKTLLPKTAITLPDTAAAPANSSGCAKTASADSAANALEVATNGNWDRAAFTSTILGESHTFSNNDYWALWVFRGGTYKVSNGICDQKLVAGDEFLASYQESDPVTFANKFFPLWITSAPSTVQAGVPFTVSVSRMACETADCLPGEGHAVPAAGATVGGATVGADGKASVKLTSCGANSLRATGTSDTPSSPVNVTVGIGPGGLCDYSVPTPTPTVGPGVTPTPTAVPTVDSTGPVTTFKGIKSTYKHGRGPRTLNATVADSGTGLADVGLSLRAKFGKTCKAFGSVKAKFRKVGCKRKLLFSVGNEPDVSFLLPSKLKTGSYTFEVIGVDAAGNRTSTTKTFTVK